MAVSFRKWTQAPPSMVKSAFASRAEYRRLGRSGLLISNPILGGAHVGDSSWCPWALDEEKSLALLKAAYDRGINTWDTANVYSNGESERIIGKALKTHGIPRSKVVIMTKCFRPVADPEIDPDVGSPTLHHLEVARKSKDYVNHFGLSRSAIFQQVEASLRRLDSNYIDVLLIHRFDPHVPPEETMEALHDLVRTKVVRYLGACSMWAHELAILQHVAEKHGWTKFIAMQNHYNLLYREEEREMNRYCNSTGVGLIPWSPLGAGKLARDPDKTSDTFRATNGTLYQDQNPAQSEEIVRRVHKVAMARKWAMCQVALAWLNKRVTAPIVGFSSAERMDQALGARGLSLSEEDEAYLEEPYWPQMIQGHS